MANSAPRPQPSRWPKCSLGSISSPARASGQSLSWRAPSQLGTLQPLPAAGELLGSVRILGMRSLHPEVDFILIAVLRPVLDLGQVWVLSRTSSALEPSLVHVSPFSVLDPAVPGRSICAAHREAGGCCCTSELQSSGKMLPGKQCWWDSSRIPPVLLGTPLHFHRHRAKVMPFLQGESTGIILIAADGLRPFLLAPLV